MAAAATLGAAGWLAAFCRLEPWIVEEVIDYRIFSVLKLNLIGYLIVNLKLNLRGENESKILISSW